MRVCQQGGTNMPSEQHGNGHDDTGEVALFMNDTDISHVPEAQSETHGDHEEPEVMVVTFSLNQGWKNTDQVSDHVAEAQPGAHQ